MAIPQNFYEILGVDRNAPRDEIRARYHQLARRYHPDRATENEKETAHRVFVLINTAYSTLCDPERRAQYDQKIGGVPSANGKSPAKPQPIPATPEEIRSWMKEANEAYLHGKLEAAHAFCRRVIKTQKAPVEAYVLIGDVYMGEHQRAKALTAYRVARHMQPDNKMIQAKIKRLEALLAAPAAPNGAPTPQNGTSAAGGKKPAPEPPAAADAKPARGFPFFTRLANKGK